jgi:Spy/CpxP family protein refolding chaperone
MLRLILVVAATGLATILAIEAAHGQGPPGLSGRAIWPPIDVELKLTDEQRGQIRDVRDEFMPYYGSTVPNQTMTPEEMKEEEERMAKILKPEQLERLRGIYLQMAPFAAVQSPSVIKKLRISGQQQEDPKAAEKKFYDNRAETGQEVSGLLQEAHELGKISAETRKKIDNLQPKPKKYVFAVLTTEQQQKFEKMEGKKFDPRAFFPWRRGLVPPWKPTNPPPPTGG